jgi:hypothetical protein
MAVLALAGGAAEQATGESNPGKPGATVSAIKGPAPAKYGYVNQAMLPLAKDFIKTFRSAKRSEREVERGTTGINTDYRNLTYLKVAKVARVKGDRSARGGAFYFNTAYFRGQIRPKNMVEFTISKHTEAARYYNRGFSISGGKTKQPGPYGIITPRLWTIDTWTPGSGSDQYDSCTINPNINEGEGYWPTLSLPIVNAGIREARKVLVQTQKRQPLGPQRDVFAGMKPAKSCK